MLKTLKIIYIIVALVILLFDIFFNIFNQDMRKLFMVITVFIAVISTFTANKKTQ